MNTNLSLNYKSVISILFAVALSSILTWFWFHPQKPNCDAFGPHSQVQPRKTYAFESSFTGEIGSVVHKIWGLAGANPNLTSLPDGIYKNNDEKEVKLNPLLSHVYWNPQSCEDLLEKVGDQQLITMYENYPEKVMKVDLARNLIMYEIGGIYQDLDVVPKKSWREIIQEANKDRKNPPGVILFQDATPNSVDALCPKERKDGWLTRIVFDTFLAKPKHGFVLDMINVQKERYAEMKKFLSEGGEWSRYCDVCYYSGPDVITTAYNRYHKNYSDIFLLPGDRVDQGKANQWI